MEQLKNYLPLATLALLVVGTMRLIQFYHFFNIDILSFLDLTEVLYLQVEFFFYTFCIIIALLIAVPPFSTRLIRWSRGFTTRQEARAQHEDTEGIKAKWHLWTMKNLAPLSLMCILVTVTSMLTRYAARQLYAGKAEYEVTMRLAERTIQTDSAYLYVGRTKSFIFFYDKPNRRGDVFANSEVKALQFFRGKDKR